MNCPSNLDSLVVREGVRGIGSVFDPLNESNEMCLRQERCTCSSLSNLGLDNRKHSSFSADRFSPYNLNHTFKSTAPMFCTSLRRRSSFASIVPLLVAPSRLAVKGMSEILISHLEALYLIVRSHRIVASIA
jgi:hypothetical protein